MEIDITLDSKNQAIIKSKPVEVKLEPEDNVEHGLMEQPADKLLGDRETEILEPKDGAKIWEVEVKVEREDAEFTEYGGKEQAYKKSYDTNADMNMENRFDIAEKPAFVHNYSKIERPMYSVEDKANIKTSTNSDDESSETEAYICDICGHTYKLKLSLIRHIKSHQQICGSNNKHFSACYETISSKPQSIGPLRTRKKHNICKICSMKCTYKAYPKDHEAIHRHGNFNCKIRKATRNNHHRIHSENKQFHCRICDRRFAYLASLKNHKRVHLERKRFSCKICSLRFACQTSLISHERTHHEKKLCCNINIFGNTWDLNSHNQIHAPDNPFSCKICKQRFPLKIKLDSHEQIHVTTLTTDSVKVPPWPTPKNSYLVTYERRLTGHEFSCAICLKQFSRESILIQHVKMLHF